MNESEIQFYATLKHSGIRIGKSERVSIYYKIHKRAMFLYLHTERTGLNLIARADMIKNFLGIPAESVYFSLSLSPLSPHF